MGIWEAFIVAVSHKLESRFLGDMQIGTTILAESEEELKSLLMRVKEESENQC